MRIIMTITDKLFKIVSAVAGVIFLAAIAINFSNVIGRYLFQVPIFWAEEIVVYGIIWCVMLGAALVCWQEQHLRVEIIEIFLAKRTISRLQTFSLLVICIVSTATAYFGFQFVSLIAEMDQRSVVTQLPMVVPFAAVPLGFLLIVVACAARLIQRLGIKEANQQYEFDNSNNSGAGRFSHSAKEIN